VQNFSFCWDIFIFLKNFHWETSILWEISTLRFSFGNFNFFFWEISILFKTFQFCSKPFNFAQKYWSIYLFFQIFRLYGIFLIENLKTKLKMLKIRKIFKKIFFQRFALFSQKISIYFFKILIINNIIPGISEVSRKLRFPMLLVGKRFFRIFCLFHFFFQKKFRFRNLKNEKNKSLKILFPTFYWLLFGGPNVRRKIKLEEKIGKILNLCFELLNVENVEKCEKNCKKKFVKKN